MSMVPQIQQATNKSSFTVLNRFVDEWGRTKVTVKGNYGVSNMMVHRAHADCNFNGEIVVSLDEWANNYYCTGCNYSEYHPIGD